MNYSKTLKPNLVGAPYKRKECNSFYYALVLIGYDYSKGNGRATTEVILSSEVNMHTITNNAKCNLCQMKNRVCDYMRCIKKSLLQCQCNPSYMKS